MIDTLNHPCRSVCPNEHLIISDDDYCSVDGCVFWCETTN